MNYWEDKYLFLCRILGANYFKKYWFFGGSYWNKYHIDKNDNVDMLSVIGSTYMYESFIANNLMISSIGFPITQYLLGLKMNGFRLGIVLGSTCAYAYIIMIQRYNRILAKRRLEEIVEPYIIVPTTFEEDNGDDDNTNENNHKIFSVMETYIGESSMFQITYRIYGWLDLPPFKNFDDAKQFIEYLDGLVGSNEFVDYRIYLYHNDIRKIYLKYASDKLAPINTEQFTETETEIFGDNDMFVEI